MSSNLTVTSVLIQEINPNHYQQSQHFGIAISSSSGNYYGPSTTKYWYPLLQAYDDKNEYYYCFRSSKPDPNPVIGIDNLDMIKTVKYDGIINYVPQYHYEISLLLYDGNNHPNNQDIYVILYGLTNFENSSLPNKNYILLKLRAANLELLYSRGNFFRYNKTGLIYIPYSSDSKEMNDIKTFGLDIGGNVRFLNTSGNITSDSIPNLN